MGCGVIAVLLGAIGVLSLSIGAYQAHKKSGVSGSSPAAIYEN